MVQEFYVLKCYSCETFQVQQVKKSKKWNCKMCGEKQSLIKEFGRGSGVDCRRHVQKLNARRGELLDVHTATALSRRDEIADNHEDFGDTAPKYESQAEDTPESRWSKFLPQPGEGQGHEDTVGEGNVNLGRNLHNGKRNVRKRKRGFGMSNVASGDLSEEDDCHKASPDKWSAAKRIVKVQNNPYSNSFIPMERSPKCLTATFRSVPAHTRQPVAQRQSFPGLPQPKPYLTGASNRLNKGTQPSRASSTTTTSTSSKWAQFLTTPSTEEEEQEEDETSWMSWDQNGNIAPCVKPVSRVDPANQEEDYETVNAVEPHCGSTSSLGGLGSADFLQRNVGGTFNRLKTTLGHCGFGKVTHSKGEPVPLFTHVERKEPVCDQPLPTKPPCPFLSVQSLFNMGEDFDVDDFIKS